MELMNQKGFEYIQRKELDYKSATETELVLRVCPFCGDDRYKFYINKNSGLYDCKICANQGNLYMLQTRFGDLDGVSSIHTLVHAKYKPLDSTLIDTYEKELWLNNKALLYLKSRGFTKETIKHFRLGLIDNIWIAIPHVQESKLWNFKQRNFIEKEFRRIPKQPTVIFNADNVITDKALLVVESETDCMAAWQLGVQNVVGLTGGAQGFKPEWHPFFNSFKEVYICLNSDIAGQRGARKLAEKIGLPKCKNVILTTNDINDYLKEGHTDFKEYLKNNAKQFTLTSISGIDSYINKIDDWYDGEGSLKGLQLSQFEKTNNILNGFKAEDLIVLSGDSGVGKTTFTLNAMLQFLQADVHCLSFCLEGKVMYYILRMMCIKTGKKVDALRDNETEWELLKDEFSEYPLFFYSGAQAALDATKLVELLPAAVKLYSIDFVVIDNLQKFVRGTHDLYARTGDAVSVLKDLAVDLKIPILLIAHITKRKSHDYSQITMHDAKASSTIFQDADVYLIIQLDKKGRYFLTIEKNRMGEGGFNIPFMFDKETARFYEGSEIEEVNDSEIDEDF